MVTIDGLELNALTLLGVLHSLEDVDYTPLADDNYREALEKFGIIDCNAGQIFVRNEDRRLSLIRALEKFVSHNS